MALRKVRSNLDRLFDKSLSDLIRGIRNNKDNEARYIAACIEEIKMELRQDSTFVKANAVEKLAYLQMMGYDMSWASFNIIEVMASTKFTEKRIGYLAASQCFHDSTDVLMLATNMIRKDLHSGNMYDTGVALGALACFVTADLARDLSCDIVNLLSSTRPYIRKRGVLLLYKMFLKYPECLKSTFPRLKEKLEDPDAGVQSAAVNVICELARKNPKNYLTLAPVFFKLMTTSSNNWMLIKIIKLFGALVPLEPRLGKKLLEPLTNLINSTSAMSLLYECINTVVAVLISVSSGVPGDHTASIQLCVQKLGVLIEDSDQNLKYLGLLAMGKILQYHPKAVQAHKDIMLRCLDDRDESIRLRALDLLYGMVSKKNIMEIARKLMDHVDAAEGSYYRDELLSRIISICSYNNFQHITNFEWYISVLVELTKVEGTKHGSSIAQQMQDVAVRVQSIRHFAVSQMALLLENAPLLLAGSEQHRANIAEVLLAAAWICGEYAEHVCNPQSVLESMLRTKTSIMPGHVLSAYVQNIAKLYSLLLLKAEAEQDWDVIESLDNLMLSKLPQFELCDHLEAQERACTLLAILRLVEQYHARREVIGEDFAKLFEGELNPVAPKAQRKVPVLEGLDLDKWIHDPPPSDELEEAVEMDEDLFGRKGLRSEFSGFGYMPKYSSDEDDEEKNAEKEGAKNNKSDEVTEEEAAKRRERRRAELENNPYYVKGDSKASAKRPTRFTTLSSAEKSEPAITELQSPLGIPGVVGLDRYMEQQQSTLSWRAAKKGKKNKKGKKGKLSKAAISSSDDDEVPIIHQVNRADGEMPENAKTTDEEETENEDEMDAVAKALDFDIEESLREEKERRRMIERTGCTVAAATKRELAMVSVDSGSHGSNVPYDNISPGSHTGETKKPKTKKTKEHKKTKLRKKRREHKQGDAEQMASEFASPQLQPIVDSSLGIEVENVSKNDVLNSVTNERDTKYITEEKRKPENKKGAKKREKKTKVTGNAESHKLPNGVEVNNTADNGDVGVEDWVGNDLSSKSEKNGALTKEFEKLSTYRHLAANDRLKLTYCASLDDVGSHVIDVGVVFSNISELFLRQLEVNILDTLNAKLIRESGSSMGGIVLDFQLPPGVSTENIFKFNVDATNVSQRLRGTLTYFEGDNSTEEKLDFHLHLPSTLFIIAATIGSEAFEVLLSSGDLTKKSSVQFDSTLLWDDLLKRLCFYGHFNVVEAKDSCASLYGQHLSQMNPICLLVKHNAPHVQIDGRSKDEQLLYSLLNDLRELLSK